LNIENISLSADMSYDKYSINIESILIIKVYIEHALHKMLCTTLLNTMGDILILFHYYLNKN